MTDGVLLNRKPLWMTLRVLLLTTFLPGLLPVGFIPGTVQGGTQTAKDLADRAQRHIKGGQLREAEAELRRALELAPRNAGYWAGLGSVLAMQQRMEEARSCFEKALELDPASSSIREQLAVSQWQTGQLENAKRNLELNLKSKPIDPTNRLLLGMVAENLKDYPYTIRLLGSIPGLAIQQPQALVALASAYYHTGQKAKAREQLNAFLVEAKATAEVFSGARLAAEAEDYEFAEKLFASIRTTYPDATLLGYNLALAQLRNSRFQACQETLQPLAASGRGNGEVFNLLGWCCQKDGKIDLAVQALNKAIELEPARESYYLDLATMLVSTQRLPDARAVLKKGLEKVPNSYALYMLKGVVAFQQRHLSESIDSYAQSVRLNPNSSEANYSLASAQLAAGLARDAAATFEKGIKQFPEDPLHQVGYATLLLKYGKPTDPTVHDRVASLLETSITLDSSQAEPHYQLGRLYMKEGKTEVALPHVEAALKLSPSDSKIHFTLASLYRSLGRRDDAAKELRLFRDCKAEESKRESVHPYSTIAPD